MNSRIRPPHFASATSRDDWRPTVLAAALLLVLLCVGCAGPVESEVMVVETVRMMARHQLGVELEDDEARELQAWPGSLTGDIPTEYIAPRALQEA